MKPLALSAIVSLLSLVSVDAVMAQVSSDGTLSTTVNSSDGNNFVIENGDRTGNNLFHSFREFSVPTGGSAYFNNAADVQNIFGRVTGGNISNIDGLIRANGSANLFLLNPSGILFGPNASLDIGGSFVGTTANRIRFADGVEFSATHPGAPPLLTLSTPIGLQMGTQANPIRNQSQARDPISDEPIGLQVRTGQTLALLGGDINFQGGALTATDGRIELGSVAPNSTVHLIAIQPGWQFNYADVQRFQAIDLAAQSTISTSGNSGGNIQIQGSTLQLQEASKILANTTGSGNGGQVILRGSESVAVVGNNALMNPTAIFVNLVPQATGNAGSLLIETQDLQVSQSALIAVENLSSGRGGDITLRAHQISLLGNVDDNGDPTVISTRVNDLGTGQGGNLTLEAQQLTARDRALIIADTASSGNSGNLNIQVDRLQVLDGAQFGTGTFGAGNGGTLTANASESIKISGFLSLTEGSLSSGLFSSAEPDSTGNGSNLNVTTQRLQITNGGKLAAGSTGTGRSGDITIRAQDIEVADPVVDIIGTVSGLLVTALGPNAGRGGSLTIDTDRLRVLRGGQVTAETAGIGQAGNILIRANEIEVRGASANEQFVSQITARSSTA
jgi:filamentous hemagglutinin family protein